MFISHYFSLYCLIFILFMNCIFSTTHDNAYLSGIGDSEAIFIDSEEIIRRQNIAENYLKENNNPGKDWVETYHDIFAERPVFTSKHIVQKNTLKNEHEIHVTFPFQNDDLPPAKNLDDSIHRKETLFTGTNLGNDPKDKILATKTSNKKILQESYKSDENGNESQDSPRSFAAKTLNSLISKEIFEDNNNMVSKDGGENYCKSRSESDKSKIFPIDCDVLKYDNLDPDVKYFSKVETDDLRLNELKNFSIDADKIIQIKIKNSKFSSKKYIIHGDTLTLTEFNKLQEYLSSLSFLQKSKNNVYSINRMEIIESIGKVTPFLKQGEFNKENWEQSCKFSYTDNIKAEAFNSEDNNIKESVHDDKKCVGHKTECKEITTQKRPKDFSLLEHKKDILPSSLEGTNRNYFYQDSEILRRKKLINPFIISLNDNQENWVESYHLNDLKSKTPSKNAINLQATEQNDESFKTHSQERFYIIRWINKLQNKFKDPSIDYRSLSISVSADLYEILGKLSQKFDIVLLDELVYNMIANATLDNYADKLYFDYENILNVIYLPLNYRGISIFIILLFCCIFLYNLLCRTVLNYNFTLYTFMLTLLITVSATSFLFTGYKMYQQKIAEKHLVMSRVVPSYCESILNKKSGVFAHIEEWFRSYWHDQDCRKYYEAVMVDPSSEINVFSISTDLLSDAVFQMLQPLARNMNSFYKILTYDLNSLQQIFLVIVTFLIVCTILYFSLSFFAFRRNYKVNFPFHLGSVEPTEFCKGSRVEEIEVKETSSSKDSSICYNISQINNYNVTESKHGIEHVILKEKFHQIGPKQFMLYDIQQSVPKAAKNRRNSI